MHKFMHLIYAFLVDDHTFLVYAFRSSDTRVSVNTNSNRQMHNFMQLCDFIKLYLAQNA